MYDEKNSFAPGDVVKHKNGGKYIILGRSFFEPTLSSCYIYRGADGNTWTRPAEQMEDGRFSLEERASSAALSSITPCVWVWIPVEDALPEERDQPYQVIAVCVKDHGGQYTGRGRRKFIQDWVVRRYPENFTHWQEAMDWPFEGCSPENENC